MVLAYAARRAGRQLALLGGQFALSASNKEQQPTSCASPVTAEATARVNPSNRNSYLAEKALPKKSLAHQTTQGGTILHTTTAEKEGEFGRNIHDISDFLTASKRNLKTDIEEIHVPVFHTFLIKSIKDNESGPQIVGTFVQQVFGIPPPKEGSDAQKGEQKPYFAYRFNEETATDDLVDLRRTEYHSAKMQGYDSSTAQDGVKEAAGVSDVCVSRHTFQIKAPLELDLEFDAFPFTVMRANVDIELSTREDKRQKNVRLRPTLMLHNKDHRNNVCIQEVESGEKDLKNTERAVALKLDSLDKYDMVSPYPEIKYYYDKKKKYCPRFSVSFWLVEEGMQKFIRIILPMALICVMNTINVVNDYMAWKNQTDDSSTEGIDRYLNNAATLALTAVFILPEIAPARNNPEFISANDAYVFLVFLALTLSSIPPRLINFPGVGFIGMALFWSSFIIPVWNMFRYRQLIQRIERERHDMVTSRTENNLGHPFLKQDDYKAWSAKKGIVDRDFKFVGDYMEGNEKEVTDEGGNKYTIEKSGKRFELIY